MSSSSHPHDTTTRTVPCSSKSPSSIHHGRRLQGTRPSGPRRSFVRCATGRALKQPPCPDPLLCVHCSSSPLRGKKHTSSATASRSLHLRCCTALHFFSRPQPRPRLTILLDDVNQPKFRFIALRRRCASLARDPHPTSPPAAHAVCPVEPWTPQAVGPTP